MNKSVFLMGMRRSGTTILMKLMNRHPNIKLEFEPYQLFYAVSISEIARYKHNIFKDGILDYYKSSYIEKKWFGAKFALNPGIEAMKWKLFDTVFDDAHFIFIIRHSIDAYNSWVKVDELSVRGTVPFSMYYPWWKHINDSFKEFYVKNVKRCCLIDYESLLEDTDKEMEKVWNTLKVSPISGANSLITKPKHKDGT